MYGQPDNRSTYIVEHNVKNLLLLTILIILFCAQSIFSQATSSDDTDLLIGIIGDQTGTYDLDAAYRVMEKAVQKMNQRRPDLVLHVGDICESIRDINGIADYRKNFARAVTIMNRLTMPWYLTAGDHDVVPAQFDAASKNREREQWFRQMCLEYELPNRNRLYYSFNAGDYHFIVLYSLENLHTDPRWGNIFLNEISAEQLQWLTADLEANKQARAIFVTIHHPQWYVWSNWSGVHSLLRQYPVKAVIAGHYHYDQDQQLIDNIHYLVAGSTGGIVKDSDAHSGGIFEYMLLRVKDRSLQSVEIYEVESDSSLELTPRRTMDRIQALSCMLDNCYGDEVIYLDRGILKTPAAGGGLDTLHMIGLESLGNPIDLPVQIEVNITDSILSSATWNYQGQQIPASLPLTLPPGERIGWSNYTSVGQWGKPAALWSCFIRQNPAYWQDKQSLSLTVRASFVDKRQRWIRSTVTFPIRRTGSEDKTEIHP